MADRDLEELLESDNELPDDYDESSELPAYLNDNRFDVVEFPWIDNHKYSEKYFENDDISSHSSKCSETIPANNIIQDRIKSSENKLIQKGILNQQDIFCLRCVATITTDITLTWFTNFLMLKDMQSDYNYLRSCLVANITNENYFTKKEFSTEFNTKHYEIIVL